MVSFHFAFAVITLLLNDVCALLVRKDSPAPAPDAGIVWEDSAPSPAVPPPVLPVQNYLPVPAPPALPPPMYYLPIPAPALPPPVMTPVMTPPVNYLIPAPAMMMAPSPIVALPVPQLNYLPIPAPAVPPAMPPAMPPPMPPVPVILPAAPVPAPQYVGTGATFLTQDAAAGSTVLEVQSNAGFAAGESVVIGSGTDSEEVAKITKLGSLYLLSPLKFSHPAGTAVQELTTSAPAPSTWQAIPEPELSPCDPRGRLCQEAAKWRQQSQQMRIIENAQNINLTTALISTETARLVQKVNLDIRRAEESEMIALDMAVQKALLDRVNAFTSAVHARQDQVVANEAMLFNLHQETEHQLFTAITEDLEKHGYQITKEAVAKEAAEAAKRFEKDPKMRGALTKIQKAKSTWDSSHSTAKVAAKESLEEWSTAYNQLKSAWADILNTFKATNRATEAARGLGEESRWVMQTVRVSADVVSAAEAQTKHTGARENVVAKEVQQVNKIIGGNSGTILTLNKMLATAQEGVQQASMARNEDYSNDGHGQL